jgi:hypothetical protein
MSSQDPGDANAFRGASAIIDGARLNYKLTFMTPQEAKKLDVEAETRRKYFRLDSAKVNITPHAEDAKWFRLVGIPIGNRTEKYPAGDNVQTIEVWNAPQVEDLVPEGVKREIMKVLDEGFTDFGGSGRYSLKPQAGHAAWMVVRDVAKVGAEIAKTAIKTWVETGEIYEAGWRDPKQRKLREAVFVRGGKVKPSPWEASASATPDDRETDTMDQEDGRDG